MLKEFKEFIQRGNVLELAVGFIMATYFGAIVKSLVNDIIMPPIGQIIGGVDFASLKIILQEGSPEIVNGDQVVTPATPEVAIMYGNFINVVVTFIIVAFAVFLVVKAYNTYLKKKEEAPAPPPVQPTEEVRLLKEIRDALKK